MTSFFALTYNTFLLFTILNTNVLTATPTTNIQDTIYHNIVLGTPQFAKQNYTWRKYLNNINDQIPIKNKAPKGKYKITFSFIVNKEGKISEIIFLDAPTPDYGMKADCIRVLKNCPRLIYLNGEFISDNKYRQSVIFQVY